MGIAPQRAAVIGRALLQDKRMDPCQFCCLGWTPFMHAIDPTIINMLQPREVTWDMLKGCFAADVDPLDRPMAVHNLLDAGQDVHWLRVPDLLFCRHEGNAEELASRRLDVWHRILKPSLKLCTMRPLNKEEKAVTTYLWRATMGPPGMARASRIDYAEDLRAELRKTMQTFEDEARPFTMKLQHDHYGSYLRTRPLVDCRVSKEHLQHARFLPKPAWALDKDLAAAARDLQRVGAVESVGDFIALLQQGTHRLFGSNLKQVFEDECSLDFWMALVALWMLVQHEALKAKFDSFMAQFGSPDEFTPGPLKKLPRILAKSKEYIEEKNLQTWHEKVLAPLWVIDVLRCTFVFETAEQALDFEWKLLEAVPLVRSKNGHHPCAVSSGGYADRKFNIVFEDETSHGRVAIIVEVQQLLAMFAKLKKKMHGCYSAERGDYG